MTKVCNKPEHPVCPKLPFVSDIKMIKCANLIMSDGTNFSIKENDLIAVQFIRPDDKIIIRKGRLKDFKIINNRDINNKIDNLSHIILDCSEQFSVKIIEIKIKDIIDIGTFEKEFKDYSERIDHLAPNTLDGNLKVPVREGGMVTKEEQLNSKKEIPNETVEMNEDGTFKDLTNKKKKAPRGYGFVITR